MKMLSTFFGVLTSKYTSETNGQISSKSRVLGCAKIIQSEFLWILWLAHYVSPEYEFKYHHFLSGD